MPLFRRKPADKPQEASNGPAAASRGEGQLLRHGSQDSIHSNGVDAVVPPPPPSPLQSAEEEYEPNMCVRTKSRLSKTLEEVLQDAGALAYLIQFAEEQGTRPLVKFWMEAQSFYASCLLRQSAPLGSTQRGKITTDCVEGDGEQQSAGDCYLASHCAMGEVRLKAGKHGTVLHREPAATVPLGNDQWVASRQASNGSLVPSSPRQILRRNVHRSPQNQCLSVTSCPSTGVPVPHGTDPLRAEDMSQAIEGTTVCAPSKEAVVFLSSSQCVGSQVCAAHCVVTGEGAAHPVHANGGEVGSRNGVGTNLRTLFTCNLNGIPPATSPPLRENGGEVSSPAEDFDTQDITARPSTERRDNDCVLYRRISTPDDHTLLQRDLNLIETWCTPWLMQLNISKCLSQDAMHIYNTYIAQNAPLPIGVPDDLRSHIQESVSRSPVDPECFFEAQQFAVCQMEKDVYPNFLRSPYHCKHQVDVLTSGSVSLADILYNDSALFYFMEFMEQEQSRHLVDFLLMADNFRGHLLAAEGGSYDPAQAQDDAMVIYDKYFSLQATSPLGFSDAVRLHVEQNICREEGPLPSCFDRPVMILLQHLEKNHLKAFLSSQLYVKYISECIVTIQTAQSDTDSLRRKKRSGSDSSSSDLSSLASQPSSTTATNTLLAVDGRWPGTPRRLLRHIEGSDMKIDSGQFNPDALWKRSLAGKLQMAHVDHLGKLTTEFEPEPDKKTGSNLTKALRKLVNWDADKAEEDMAWQVAEMIVKDICSITLCPNATSDDIG
ncbi:A-kinase anchoring protein pkaap isoform X2 [Amblyomma americanum]